MLATTERKTQEGISSASGALLTTAIGQISEAVMITDLLSGYIPRPTANMGMRKEPRSKSAEVWLLANPATSPCAVNFTALPIKFIRTCPSLPGSPRGCRGTFGSTSHVSKTRGACKRREYVHGC
jgi:hypothetical protein